MKINVVDPKAWMLTSVFDAQKQLAMCAYAAGISRGRTMDSYRVPVYYDDDREQLITDVVGGGTIPLPLLLPLQELADAEGLVSRLLNMKPHAHETVIEHSAVSFLFRMSRIASHETVRHRLCAITQMSTRYCEEGKGDDSTVTFIRPLGYPEDVCREYDLAGLLEIGVEPYWVQAGADAIFAYQEERRRGVKREFARYLLPHCLCTWMVLTANFREWRHIIRLRTSKKAAPEMRMLFGQVKEQLAQVSPVLVGGL
jgi:thymidylate synthase (FAD)